MQIVLLVFTLEALVEEREKDKEQKEAKEVQRKEEAKINRVGKILSIYSIWFHLKALNFCIIIQVGLTIRLNIACCGE